MFHHGHRKSFFKAALHLVSFFKLPGNNFKVSVILQEKITHYTSMSLDVCQTDRFILYLKTMAGWNK